MNDDTWPDSTPQQPASTHQKNATMVYKETKRGNHPGHDFCMSIASKVNSESDFPIECMQYDDAVSLFKMHSNSNPYAGMSPGEAIDAKRAKSEGHLNSAQIKRRMTTRKNGRIF